MQTLDRFLLHPHIQRLGAIQVLVGIGIFGWGFVKGVDPLIAVGMILFAANVVLLVMQRSRRSHAEDKGGAATVSDTDAREDRESIVAEFVTMIEVSRTRFDGDVFSWIQSS